MADLKALLREASAWLIADSKLNKDYAVRVMDLRRRIDKALAEETQGGVWPCPSCRGPMKMRVNSRSGKGFYGCAAYPKCKATRELDGLASKGLHPDPHGNMDGASDDIFDLDGGGWGVD